MKNKQSVVTASTLANAAELTAAIASEILGGEVAETFAGAPLNKDMLHQLSMSVFQKKINHITGV